MTFLQTLDAEIAAQQRVLEAHPAYVKLKALQATRALYVGSVAATKAEAPADASPSRGRGAPLSGKSLEAVNAVVEHLRATGKPARTAELMTVLEAKGIQFSGNAPQNILSSLLSRSPDVESKGGHIGWALKEWDTAGDGGLPGTSPPAVNATPAQGREAGPGGGT